MVLALDLDNTLIFKNNKRLDMIEIERVDNKPVSYISRKVLDRLIKLRDMHRNKLTLVCVTSRNRDCLDNLSNEFMRLFDYVVCDTGGIIYKNNNGKFNEDLDYREYVESKYFRAWLLRAFTEMDNFESVRSLDIRDGLTLFGKVDKIDDFDTEIEYLDKNILNNVKITRTGNTVIVVPEHFNKGVAVRFVQNKLRDNYLISSGDSLIDVSMLAISDMAIIPEHSELVKDKIITDGNIVGKDKEKEESFLETFELVEKILSAYY